MKLIIPRYVLDSLDQWHQLASEYDPENHSPEASERAIAAWNEFQRQCLRWEKKGRARRRLRK